MPPASPMDVSEFDFDLPAALIADRPARPRGSARMLVVGGGALEDRKVSDLPQFLRAGDVLVCNDTRVLAARLRGVREARRGTARIEATLIRALDGHRWSVLARPAKRLRPGDRVRFGELAAEVEERREDGEVILRFAEAQAALVEALERQGTMPLPPYLGREPDEADRDDYQTVFARHPGAVAAPTAGLHFTEESLAAVAEQGVSRVFVTLHVSAGTFLPVKAEDVSGHRMQPEWGEVGEDAAAAINAARDGGGRIIAAGTTALRLLESVVDVSGTVRAFRGETDLFVVPGHRFRSAEVLLTNFHLPRSTLFMLVCAFSGTGRMRAAYEHAKAAAYRFYSYGDCCLLHRAGP